MRIKLHARSLKSDHFLRALKSDRFLRVCISRNDSYCRKLTRNLDQMDAEMLVIARNIKAKRFEVPICARFNERIGKLAGLLQREPILLVPA